jgi:hypothetical protein
MLNPPGQAAEPAPTASTSAAAASSARNRPLGRRGGPAVGSRLGAKAPAPRRRYQEYAEEYGYVWADLRRIVLVAGVLIALLVVLSFYIQ